jgi:predicted permease
VAEWLNSLRLRLRALFRRPRQEQDLDDEIAFHLEMREAQLRESGIADADARARARFGSPGRVREELRETWALSPRLGNLVQDFRYAGRILRRSPGFTLVVVLTLGFGIAINTATFSIVNAVLIRPLGFVAPDRLVALHENLAGFAFAGDPFSPPDFLDLARDQQSFQGVAAYRNVPVELSGGGEPIRLDAAKVTTNLFSVLGVSPVRGRDFTSDEDRPGVDVAVLSWGLWHTRFARDEAIIGRSVTIDRRPYTVIGVMPAGFEFPRRGPESNDRPASLWLPMAFTDRQRQTRGNEFNQSVVGRLKDDVSIEEARAELDLLTRRINASYPPILQKARFSIALSAMPLRDEIAGKIERPLLLLLGAVGLVLIVTCANVANLVLSRSASRTREITVRSALGSSQGRLVQLLLAESTILSAAGAALGVVLARLIVGAMPTVVADMLPASQAVTIDGRVLGFTAAIAIATAITFALIPLATFDRRSVAATLQEEASRATSGRRRHRLQAGLVVATVMLAVVLLVGAGLFLRSLSALMATDAGFNPERVLTASIALPRDGYPTATSVRAFHTALFTSVLNLPGVRSAALGTDLPLESYERRTLTPEGVRFTGDVPRNTNLSWVHGPYFETLGVRLKSGRLFSDVETFESRRVVIINDRLARTFWPGEDAVGKRLRWGLDTPKNPNPWLTVVGIIDDVVDGPLGVEPFTHAYEPFSQFPDVVLNNMLFGRQVELAIRAEVDPLTLVPAVRAQISRIDPQLAIESIVPMTHRVGDGVAPRRLSAIVLGAFAAGALLLAAIGLYGLLAFTVAERRREIAVRLALGAELPMILSMVIGRGMKLVAIGLIVGVLTAFAMARTVASLLYQTESHDLVTFGAVSVVLAITGFMACAIPAYRASRVEPITALRTE